MHEYGEEAFTMITDMFEDSVIVRWYSYIDGTSKLMRVKYTCSDEGVITLGDVNEVHITYEDVVTQTNNTVQEETGVEQATETSTEVVVENAESSNANAETAKEDDDKKDEEDPKDEDPKDKPEDASCGGSDDDDEDKKKADAACDSEAASAAQVQDAEVTPVTEASVENEEPKFEEEGPGSTSFAEGERAEFEALKREKKVSLVDSYKDYLSEEEYTDFISRVDTSTEEELELDLLKVYKNKRENTRHERAFAFAPITKKAKQDSLDSWVKKNL